MVPTTLIIGSNGSEEIEMITTAVVLRRAGIKVTIAGLQNRDTIVCTRNISLNVDAHLEQVKALDFDAVILPGGQPGSNKLAEHKQVGELLRRHEKNNKIVAAICAAPLAFMHHKIAIGGIVTSHPSVHQPLKEAGYTYSEENICVYKHIVTSRGPGTAFEFALTLVELLLGQPMATKIRNDLLLA